MKTLTLLSLAGRLRRYRNHFNSGMIGLVTSFLLAASQPMAAQALVIPQTSPPNIDVTFAFISDVHSTFNGINDYEGLETYVSPVWIGPFLTTKRTVPMDALTLPSRFSATRSRR